MHFTSWTVLTWAGVAVRGSSPVGQSFLEQSWPEKPGSQTQPKIFTESQTSLYVNLSPVTDARDWEDRSEREMQTPLVLQLFAHASLWQACPEKPSIQEHVPVSLSQCPRPEHSEGRWEVSSAVEWESKPEPDGQVLSWQFCPFQPAWQVQRAKMSHFPWREHSARH